MKLLSLFKAFKKKITPEPPRDGSDLFERLGGMEAIDKLVDEFYAIMATDPLAEEVFATHHGLEIRSSAEKLKYFLSGWTGGPQLYLEKYGHPRLRMRHFPFKIGAKEADQWLYCMRKALAKSSIGPGEQEELINAFGQITQMLRNQDTETTS